VGIQQDRPARSEPDIDQLFAPEPDGTEAPSPPALIFTEPIDSHEHQFADEAAVFAEERVVPAAAGEAVAADARWAEAQAPADLMLRFFQVAAALVVFVGALFLFLMPDGSRREGLREPSGPRRLSLPESREAAAAPPASTPAPAEPAPVLPRPAIPAHEIAPARASTGSAAAPQAERSVASRPSRLPDAGGPVLSAAARGPARSMTAAPPPASLPAPVDVPEKIPSLDVERLPTDAGSLLGAPVPAARVPTANTSRPAAPEGRPAAPPAPAVSATPTGTSGIAAVDARAAEQGRVRAVLSRYEAAYSDLDASAAASLYPSIDRKALSRAFDALASQQILFEDCRIQGANATARATCAGTASWTPKVGTGFRQQARRWQFDLKQVSGTWQIGKVEIQ
jgi:hypothetical protein